MEDTSVAALYSVVVAIDFGTTRTGYHYTTTSDPSYIRGNRTWPHVALEQKTTTEVLLRRSDQSFVSFGYDARRDFACSKTPDEFLYFSDFKMALHNKEGVCREKIKASNVDESVETEKLISVCLKAVVDRAYRELCEGSYMDLSFQSIRWVITVPAIWDLPARHAMLRAAERCGIASKDVLIALEPEAAALTCIYGEKRGTLVIPGSTFMVVDAGGGTVDITVHRTATNGLVEVLSPSGGAWGSSYINAKFVDLLVALLGHERISNVKNSMAYLDVLKDFENAKVSFDRNKPWFTICLAPIVPTGLSLQTNVEAFNLAHKTKITLDEKKGYMLKLDSAYEYLFGEVIVKIVKHIDALLGKLQGMECMFVVGGFAECPMLQEAIKDKFSGRVKKIVVPPCPTLAVVNGAVRYGLSPRTVMSRVAMKSIGMQVLKPWEDGKHQGRMQFLDYKSRRCCSEGIFIFVKAGESVDTSLQIVHTFYPTSAETKTALFKFFEYARDGPWEFSTDAGSKLLGYLDLAVPDVGKPVEEREMRVVLMFGGTTFQATATYVKRKEVSVSATFNILLDDVGYVSPTK